MQVIGPNQEKWLQALESGDYSQGFGNLRNIKNEFCCIGVAAEIFGCKMTRELSIGTDELLDFYYYDNQCAIAPMSVVKDLKLYSASGASKCRGSELTVLNDQLKYSFKQIAAYIRSNPADYFSESN